MATSAALNVGLGLSLREALYWLAAANLLSNLLLAYLVRDHLRMDRLGLLLITGSIPMTVMFSLLLPQLDLGVLQLGMGLAVIAAGIGILRLDNRRRRSPNDALKLALPAGVASGVLGGLFGMSGPALILVLGTLDESPSAFRGRMVLVTLLPSALRFFVLLGEGAYRSVPTEALWTTLPAVIVGTWVGHLMHRALEPRYFRLVLVGLVFAAGALAVVDGISAIRLA